MTEDEWLTCTDPLAMVMISAVRSSLRKLRLFDCACCRRIWLLMTEGCGHHVVEVAERFADGMASTSEIVELRSCLDPLCQRYDYACYAEEFDVYPYENKVTRSKLKHSIARACLAVVSPVTESNEQREWKCCRSCENAVGAAVDFTLHTELPPNKEVERERIYIRANQAELLERAHQVRLAREIFGNPFHHLALDPVWLTWNEAIVVRLAQAAYDNRLLPAGMLDNARLAILADALEEAGCDDEFILGHLRGDGEHYRGCFVVDALLGKS